MIEIKPGRYRHYKLHQVGEALAWEYIRNVGIDGAKPDTHIRRFLGSDRMGDQRGKKQRLKKLFHRFNGFRRRQD